MSNAFRMSRLLIAGLFVAMLGCSSNTGTAGKATSPEAAELKGIYEIYVVAGKNLGHPPKSVEDFKGKGFEGSEPVSLAGIKSGKFIVVWGVSPKDGGKSVLAYGKEVPNKGGSVLLANGDMVEMTPDQLKNEIKK